MYVLSNQAWPSIIQQRTFEQNVLLAVKCACLEQVKDTGIPVTRGPTLRFVSYAIAPDLQRAHSFQSYPEY